MSEKFDSDTHTPRMPRRKFVQAIGSAFIASPVLHLAGCGSDSSPGATPPTNAGSSSSASSTAATSSSASSAASSAATLDGWASGGTDAMRIEFPPPNPFSRGSGTVCRLTGDLTLGPCYFDPDDYRQDISDGELGVPVVFAIQALDANCEPLAGVTVDLWHTNHEGFYSGDNSGSSSREFFLREFCADNNARALRSRWHRGVQITDLEGVAYFKSCFPGWYAGRTNHIHLRFVHNGQVSLDTQLGFPDSVCNEIFTTNPDYSGQRQDTSGMGDSVFGAAFDEYLMTVEKNSDRSMLAYKAVSLNI